MRKTYRTHGKRVKRKYSRKRRRGGGDIEEKRPTVSGNVEINKSYLQGYNTANNHIKKINDLTENLKSGMDTANAYRDTIGAEATRLSQPYKDSINNTAKKVGNTLNDENLRKPYVDNMNKQISNAYQLGMKSVQPHVEQMNKMATDLHKQATDNGKKAYSSFKYSSPTNFAMAKSGESAISTASKSMQPHYNKMISSMGSMGSSMGTMGFSSLSSNKPNVTELEHAQKASSMGVPSAFSPSSQVSSL